jgi:hypothetical protein
MMSQSPYEIISWDMKIGKSPGLGSGREMTSFASMRFGLANALKEKGASAAKRRRRRRLTSK